MCRGHLFSLLWIIADFYRKLSSPIKPGPGPAYNAIKSFLSILLKQNNKTIIEELEWMFICLIWHLHLSFRWHKTEIGSVRKSSWRLFNRGPKDKRITTFSSCISLIFYLPGRRHSWCRLRPGWSGRDLHRWRRRRGGRHRRSRRRGGQPSGECVYLESINI